ncbi:tetratricopeptide repeat protein [Muricoccus radiodurans]|uniref:tetratricopeptide repeat protein n=1 Tax=Muricoccus radiodurans TaxID=2231721 RepID=UPI003CF8C89A
MPDIFDELQEDLRAERARQFWLRYGGLLAGLALLVLLGVGGWQGWRWYENRGAEAAGSAFMALHRSTERQGADLADAARRFDAIAADAPVGYRTLSLFRAAALKDETGDKAGALADYDRIANDRDADPLYRDLASLMWVLHGLDTTDPAALAARITPLTVAGAPWRASAQELQALIAVRRGETAEARRVLQALVADTTAPRGVRDRAARLMAQLEG